LSNWLHGNTKGSL